MGQYDHEDQSLIDEMQRAARERMRDPLLIEGLISHIKTGGCGGNPDCNEEIIKVLEWVLGKDRRDNPKP